ncbi:MAG: phosphate signaling complex protein PhoU [Thermodesulfobacteriota bacterium]|nr:phosphate signaling complex protein PhoU [Thermodesulfobacteriota bacterium]
MKKHLQTELEQIKKTILELGAMTEDRLQKAITAVYETNQELAREIIKTDYEIDNLEVEIEEECLKIIALHQPVAIDLRLLAVTIKINNDLERIADEAVNIAHRVKALAESGMVDQNEFYYDYMPMGKKVRNMVKKSLNAFVSEDARAAREVLVADDEVDLLRGEIYDILRERGDNHTIANTGYLLNMFLISRHLERIADHATNIAEEVIYMVEGEIVRHTDIDAIDDSLSRSSNITT